ncbi:AraC family ligand binding domain-containing protein [Nitrincola sp. A-D6]|uniref:AraC family ligand binding domain-containing protein n=1 Tax=Nitrincola sp. A-D6 TaxID=1545442 RepID=UPI0009DF82AA
MMSTTPIFWRDPALPHVELRYIEDGRQVRYAPHSHQQWSLGVILAGQSYFQYAGQQQVIEAGQLLLINPHQVHACNPCADMPWSYYMLYIDSDWLTRLRQACGELDSAHWKICPCPVWRIRHYSTALTRWLSGCLILTPVMRKRMRPCATICNSYSVKFAAKRYHKRCYHPHNYTAHLNICTNITTPMFPCRPSVS